MGRPDQGNKAQTLLGYSHGTGVCFGNLATADTGVHPGLLQGLSGLAHFPMTALPVLAKGCGGHLVGPGYVWSRSRWMATQGLWGVATLW